MKSLKNIISSFLATAMICGSFSGIAFAQVSSVTGVTWKETAGTTDQTVTEVYSSATGTFNTGSREVVHSTDSSGSQTYYFGVGLANKITSGTLVIDAEFSNPDSDAARLIRLFALSDDTSGWKATKQSGLTFSASKKLTHDNSSTANNALYAPRWTDVMGQAVAISDTDEVYDLKFVASAATAQADWNVNVYHQETHRSLPVYSYTIPRAELPDIKYIVNSNWLGKNKTAKLTVNKFLVTTYEGSFNAEYEPENTDYEDRKVKINVTTEENISAVDAYIVYEQTGEKVLLDTENSTYSNGVAEITVPTSVYGIISIDLVLMTAGGHFTVNVPLEGDPFEEVYVERPKSLVLEEISEGTDGGTLKVDLNFSEIVLKFNNNIDPTTISAVTFTGEGVSNLQKALTDDNKTLTLTFDPLTDKKIYTLTIGTGLKSQNSYYIEQEKTYVYQVDSDLNKLNIISHNTETVYTLLPGAMKLELEFNFEPDSTTLGAGLEFAKSDGSSIPGGYSISAGNSSNKVVISFGRLSKGEYKLKTNSSLKATDTTKETRIAEWSFKVATDDDSALVYEDFSGLTEGTQDYQDLAERITSGIVSYSDPGAQEDKYKIKKTESGENYLLTTAKKGSAGGGISVSFPNAITSGRYAVDLTFKAVGSSVKRNLFTLYGSSSSKKVFTIYVTDSNSISKNNDKLTVNGTFTGEEYATDDEGFYHLRAVMQAPDAQSNWDILIYDMLSSTKKPIYKISMGREYDSSNKLYGLESINKISFFDLWLSGDETGEMGMAVKEFALRQLPVPAVLSSNLTNPQPDISSLELVVDSDLDESQISDTTVKLKAADGTVIASKVSYKTVERKLTLIPEEYLEYDTEYTIEFENMICTNYSFRTAARQTILSSEPVLNETNGVLSIGISIQNNSGENKAIYAIAKVIDSGNSSVSAVKGGKFNAESGSPLNDELSLEGITVDEGDKVKVYIFESHNGHIRALVAPHELIR